MKLATSNDEKAPNVELMVTDIAVGDELSLVPVSKMGNLVQYQIVLNIPIPTFIQNDESAM